MTQADTQVSADLFTNYGTKVEPALVVDLTALEFCQDQEGALLP